MELVTREARPPTPSGADWTTDEWTASVVEGIFAGEPAVPQRRPTAPSASAGMHDPVGEAYLLNPRHWMPLDYDLVTPAGLGGLVVDHRRRVERIDQPVISAIAIGYAAVATIVGLSLHIASWAAAVLSTLVTRPLTSAEGWDSVSGRRLRPRPIAAIAADHQQRAGRMQAHVPRAAYLVVSVPGRVVAQALNLTSYALARAAATVNAPSAAATAAIPAGVALIIWLVVAVMA